MSMRNLDYVFKPQSVAVIGATPRPRAIGSVVTENLLTGGFAGPILPVTPKHSAVHGVLAYDDVDSLPLVPDLAVICTPAATVPDIAERLGRRGVKGLLVLSAGLRETEQAPGVTLTQALLRVAKQYGMRILGPNSLGLLVPGLGLNASFAHTSALPGSIAFVSQSGALCTTVLDWAKPRGIGFSHFVSLGDMAELDFGDVLDYLGSDPATSSILLYMESIHHNRTFMSAARAAARNKPLLVLKAGRVEDGARAARSHTGALTSNDLVYDAAFARAGMLRVYEFEELFAAVETLSRRRLPKGERLAIVTNGGGLGVMAVDDLIERGGVLAHLSDETVAQLDGVLPPTWSKANPVDLIGDAGPERYRAALEILAQAPEVDAVLALHCPVAVVEPQQIASTIAEVAQDHKGKAGQNKTITTCFVGELAAAPARALMAQANIPCFDTPLKAVQAFMHTVHYRRNQEILMEIPPSLPSDFRPATATARLIVERALASGQSLLSEPEAKAVLAAYGIPTVETHIAASPAEAARHAEQIGFPVVLKVISQQISHKSDVGGVILGLKSAAAVEQAGEAMLRRLRDAYPEAQISGFSVQQMARREGAHELIVGVTSDAIFGPVILFGAGGTAVEVINDRAVALPPLNMSLAQDLVSRTKVSKLLAGYRNQPAADMEAICLTLNQVAQLIIDLPEIVELDINPLFADSDGVLALDARIKVAAATCRGSERLAIRPYPKELEGQWTLGNGRRVTIRPIRPEDEPNHHVFISRLTPEDIRFRFFGLLKELPHSQMARLTQIDYDREMALLATAPDAAGQAETLGVVRVYCDPDNDSAEFSIVVRSDLKGGGLGRELLERMITYCQQRGVGEMVGQVLSENRRMLTFVKSMGFRIGGQIEPGIVEVRLALAETPAQLRSTGS